MRRHFIRRVAIFMAFFLTLVFVLSTLAVMLLAGALGVDGGGGLVVLAALLGVVLLFVLFAVGGRFMRGMAAPLGDMMEAADRVADGDLSARVQTRGFGYMRRLTHSFNEMAARLEANEMQRRNLLADVTHELRTPLSVIKGSTEAMLDGVHPADEAHLRPILDETTVMARLLEDLQTLSTAESGALRLHRSSVEPAELVDDALAAFKAPAAAKDVRLVSRVAPGLPVLDVDVVRIGEVLANLLSNAVRHSPAGAEVVVGTTLAESGGVEFSVEDAGGGIAPEDLSHVFERFVKSADSGGVGLGLAIAKSLVEAHGGTITASAGEDGGTTMKFTLPAEPT